jgi:hypothetical protein
MSDKRQDLIDFAIVQLKTIADFDNNVGDFETNWHQDELPAISVFDNETSHDLKNVEETTYDGFEDNSQLNFLSLTIQIFVKSGTRAEDVRALIKKVREVIAENRTWNDLALWSKPVRTQIQVDKTNPETTNFEIIGASVEIEICLISNAFDF